MITSIYFSSGRPDFIIEALYMDAIIHCLYLS